MGMFVSGPRVFGDGSFEREQLSWRHAVDVLGHGAIRVNLDEEVHEAALIWKNRVTICLEANAEDRRLTFVADRCVRSDHRLLGIRSFKFCDDGSYFD